MSGADSYRAWEDVRAERAARQYLSGGQAAERLGLAPSTWRALRSRRKTPPPDVWIGSTPGWLPETVDQWERPGQGARTDKTNRPASARG